MLDTIIKSTVSPKINLKKLSQLDTSSDSDNIIYRSPNNLPSAEQTLGVTKPFIKIADNIINEIEYLEIDET
jgi:hypothetical protein